MMMMTMMMIHVGMNSTGILLYRVNHNQDYIT
jgi:hypothetical protein